jgi:PmbA protein
MMLDTIASVVSALAGVSDWRLTETRRAGAEAFFIKEGLDMTRAVEAVDYRLSVCVDGPSGSGPGAGPCRGEASVSIHPSMSKAEVKAAAQRAVFAASKSRNPWYPLPEPGPAQELPASGFSGLAPAAWLGELREALYSGQAGHEGTRINSLELFLTRIDTRIRNSRGLDAAWQSWKGYTEYTVESPSREGQVELTDFLAFAEPDYAGLAGVIGRSLDLVADRALARPMPSDLDLPLLLTGKDAAEVLGYWWRNLNAARVYSKASPFALGSSLHGDAARPGSFDPLEICAESFLPGSPDSSPRDAEGSALEKLSLSSQGVAAALSGPLRHCHYLGLPPVGDHPLFSVAPGSSSSAQLRSQPHLEVAFFSDFGVDLDSGDFGAEVRLAYVSDGGKSFPVTGGSVAGNLGENAASLRLSRDLGLSGPMRGPEAILLSKVSITGV